MIETADDTAVDEATSLEQNEPDLEVGSLNRQGKKDKKDRVWCEACTGLSVAQMGIPPAGTPPPGVPPEDPRKRPGGPCGYLGGPPDCSLVCECTGDAFGRNAQWTKVK